MSSFDFLSRHACPECGKDTIVLHRESEYVCINRRCRYRYDVAETQFEGAQVVLFLLAAIAGWLLWSERSPTEPSVQPSIHQPSPNQRQLFAIPITSTMTTADQLPYSNHLTIAQCLPNPKLPPTVTMRSHRSAL